MRIFLTVLRAILILVIILVATVWIFLATFDVNKYASYLSQKISQLIGREVAIEGGELDFSLGKGVALKLKNFAIKDSPAFTEGNFLVVAQVNLRADFLSLLSQKRIIVHDAEFKNPELVIVRNFDGTVNVPALVFEEVHAAEGIEAAGQYLKQKIQAASVMPDFLIDQLLVTNGKITFIDQIQPAPSVVTINQFDLEVLNFALNKPVDFTSSLALFSKIQNTKIQGTVQVDSQNKEVRVRAARSTTDLSLIEPGLFDAFVPALKPAGLNLFKGELNVQMDTLTLSEKGMVALSAEGTLVKGLVQFRSVSEDLRDIRAVFLANGSQFELKAFDAYLGTGHLSGSFDLKDYLKNQIFSVQMEVTDLRLQDLPLLKNEPVHVEGELNASLKLNGQGLNPHVFSTLSGSAEWSLLDGKAAGFNVLTDVLSKVTLIPGLLENLTERLPKEWQARLQASDTILEKAQGRAVFNEGKIVVDGTQLQTKDFGLDITGEVGLNTKVLLNTALYIYPDLSSAMVFSVPALMNLLDEQGRILIPVQIKGIFPHFTLTPDVDFLSKQSAVREGTKELRKVLDKNPEANGILNILLGTEGKKN